MSILEIALVVVAGYVSILLLLEAVIWKVQPTMEGGVTLIVGEGDDQFSRTLYGFQINDRLYVSSNHWFRKWYHAVLQNPNIGVERDGEVKPYTAVPIDGEEKEDVARQYKMGFMFRLLCGFAPRLHLRLDPR